MQLLPDADLFAMLARSGPVIKGVMYLLLGLSLGSWSLIFTKLIQVVSARRQAERDRRAIEAAADVDEVLGCGGGDPDSDCCALAREGMAEIDRLRGMAEAGETKGALLESVRQTLNAEVEVRIQRIFGSLSFLATCANVSPLLGLFGTVWGIMHSFSSFAGPGAEAVSSVAPGLAEALVTTAFGLVVAIPAVLAYNLLLKMISGVEAELNRFSGAFLNLVKGNPLLAACPVPADESGD